MQALHITGTSRDRLRYVYHRELSMIGKYGSCPENKKEGVGFKFLSYRVFGGFFGGTEGVRAGLP